MAPVLQNNIEVTMAMKGAPQSLETEVAQKQSLKKRPLNDSAVEQNRAVLYPLNSSTPWSLAEPHHTGWHSRLDPQSSS